VAALKGGDVDGAYVAVYDGYRMAAESLLTLQGLRATGGDGSHITVEDAVSAQFAKLIPVFVRPILSDSGEPDTRRSTSIRTRLRSQRPTPRGV
jgi:hypothetical protein